MEGKVENLGGLFIHSNNPKKLAEWYESHFGLVHETWGDSNVYYISFPYTDSKGNKRYIAWSINPSKEKLSNSKTRQFTINLRVSNLEQLISKLESMQVSVKPMEVHDEGKFAWCEDLDGNNIELWEDVN